MSDDNGFPTTQGPNQASSEYNAQLFIFESLMNKRHFAEPVEVMSVTIPDGVGKAGRVSVKPLINMLDANGNAVPHQTINNLTYFRLQGGTNAFVIDPQVGDKGFAIFADRDMSSVKANEAAANPGSARRSSWSDGWYIGGLLNAEPVQYVRMSADGIEVVSPTAIKLDAPQVVITSPDTRINGPLHVTGAITSDTSVTAPNVTGTTDVIANGISLHGHRHNLVRTGTDNSGGPI